MTYSSKAPLILLLTLIATFGRSEDGKKEAQALLDRTRQLSNIRSDGAPAFKLTAQFKITDQQGTTTQGSYQELWANHAERRREINLENTQFVEVIEGHKRWSKDSYDNRFGQLESIIDFSFSDARFKKLKKLADRQVEGIIAECVVTDPNPRGGKSALCFDKTSGLLVERIYPSALHDKFVDENCEYSDYQKFAGKTFPRSVSCFQSQRMTRAATLELSPLTPDATTFAPPPDTKESVNCLDSPVVPPKPTFTPDPDYPKGQSQPDRPVVLWMVIGTDGKPRDLKVARTVNNIFDNAALEAVKRWTFQPASCFGQPVAVQINVEVSFRKY